ncbi:hypothetical protein [Gordonia sp. MMO-8]|uniref:hypothetical protein n=1 Tax=Gordonia sp. MMO-8 TaxID=3127886 RepID=UPI0030167367
MAIQRIRLDVLMNDGTEHNDVVVTNADRFRAEQVGRRQKWGTLEESQQTYSMFWAYAALSRAGKYTGTFDAFVNDSETIAQYESEDVDPTSTATPTD